MKTRHVVLGPVVVLSLLTSAQAVSAQADAQPRRTAAAAVVITEAPVYLLPDATRKPLRMLPVSTALTVTRTQGEWLEVTFNDPQFGRRTGWIQQKFVKVSAVQPTPEPPPPPPTAKPTAKPPAAQAAAAPAVIGFRGFGTVTFDKMTASDSFRAVTGEDTVVFWGGGAQVTNLWRGLFAEVAFEFAKKDGERVFVGPNDEVFQLGIPLEIKMMPVDIVGGWRTPIANNVLAYGAGGISFLTYEETSDFAEADENVDENFNGFVLFGGIEYRATQWVHVRGEVRYRRFGDAIGAGGVSAAFDEDDLGSFGFALKVAVGR
jgi:opacity protein-like surface antigen